MNLAQKYIQKHIDELSKNSNIPHFGPGDTLRVHNKISEDNNQRIQIFEGVCIARNKRQLGSTFKVKKITNATIFEKTFPLYSPLVTKIEVTRRGVVKRAKLYYMRELVGKAARIKEKMSTFSKKKKS